MNYPEILTLEDLNSELLVERSMLIAHSYEQHFIEFPIQYSDPIDLSIKLYHAPFVVFAGDIQEYPFYFYMNLRAQQMFHQGWDSLLFTPMIQHVADQDKLFFIQKTKQILLLKKQAGVSMNFINSSDQRIACENIYMWSMGIGTAWMVPLF